MTEVNLLPKNLEENKKITSLSRLFTRTAIVISALVILVVAMGIGGLVLLGRQRDEAQAKQSSLAQRVAALEQTEQRLVLTKDRLGRIKSLLARRRGEEAFGVQKKVFGLLPTSQSFNRASIVSGNLNLSLNFETSEALSNFVGRLEGVQGISKINLESLTFSIFDGFTVDFNL